MDSNQFNNGQQPNPYFNDNSGYQQPQKAPNIFRQLAFSFVPPKYERLTKVKTGSMIGFVTLLALVVTIVEFIIFSVGFALITKPETLEEYIPEFSLKNGELSISEEVVLDQATMLIYITDEQDYFTRDEVQALIDKGYTQVMLVGKKNFALMQNEYFSQISYKDLGSDFSIDKDWAINELPPIVWICCAIGYVFYFVGRIFWYFICAAAYLLLGLIICSAIGKKVSEGALYRVAVYAKVPMFLIALLFSMIPFVGSGLLTLVRPIVTIALMVFAIQKL
ncbi:MAG: DUF1189 domain-containing protein [Bacteroidales bacterium]|nr:DUF1189 domain-containing protein [Lachnoclostridium sp.]MCM1385371.1 DUF1189 domain-containing protein [Lachnoclostridium sp.]MCM1466191.1 DUF1189 domain-containing protein [Bacteroidales bacterium]